MAGASSRSGTCMVKSAALGPAGKAGAAMTAAISAVFTAAVRFPKGTGTGWTNSRSEPGGSQRRGTRGSRPYEIPMSCGKFDSRAGIQSLGKGIFAAKPGSRERLCRATRCGQSWLRRIRPARPWGFRSLPRCRPQVEAGQGFLREIGYRKQTVADVGGYRGGVSPDGRNCQEVFAAAVRHGRTGAITGELGPILQADPSSSRKGRLGAPSPTSGAAVMNREKTRNDTGRREIEPREPEEPAAAPGCCWRRQARGRPPSQAS